jgi:hypothetical protein
MNTLHLTLKKKWFDMSHPKNAKKNEEYRSIKPYWDKRLAPFICAGVPFIIKARNGYRKDSPVFERVCDEITIGFPNPDWTDDPDRIVYRLSYSRIKE